MSDWIDVARQDEFPPGDWRSLDVDGAQVAVFNLAGEYYAIEDTCTHDGGTLTGGYTPWLCNSRDITIWPSVM